MANILKKLFGSKADRDIKQINPTLKLVLAAYDRIDKPLGPHGRTVRADEVTAAIDVGKVA